MTGRWPLDENGCEIIPQWDENFVETQNPNGWDDSQHMYDDGDDFVYGDGDEVY